ncbi:PIN domain-containing protein [Agrobacterium sp. Azo12]|uniref:PIN domain-containing protein n=1 Tax=Agrobacterium sp. Azo12 TaxID=3031129 RepID=UPI0023D7E204|nr:PIN domain-containing protein [Agrobacterium sp. Azo12]MDO5897866.1 PIN domain-containing protein [Agrobacterium sp. Azo12]
MAAGYILDTCVLSETSRVRPNPGVVRFIETASNLFIPAAAIMEFQQGITQLCSRDPVKAVRLTRWYQNLMALGMPILETGKEVAEAWGTLAADQRLRNLIVSHPGAKRLRHGQDLHIAATALVHRTPIATFNTKDFLLIHSCYPLPGIYNPVSDTWHATDDTLIHPEKIGSD